MRELAAFYDEFAKKCDETDFWGQVRRTVNGKPVPQEQIDLIVEQMTDALDLRADDVLLDICCGNGALSTRFFEKCAGGLGVDYSETLIEVARKYFAAQPSVTYRVGDAKAYLSSESETARFTKAIIYGSISYFPRSEAEALLTVMRQRFANVSRLVVGNVADMNRLHDFFGDRYEDGIEERPDSAIGVWWSRRDFAAMAKRAGWSTEIMQMPENFYASRYRFDAVLRPE